MPLVLNLTLLFSGWLVFWCGLGWIFLIYGKFSFWLIFVPAALLTVLQFLIGPWILSRIFKLREETGDRIPSELKEFIVALCREKKIPPPGLGIVKQAFPNIFSYGNRLDNARLIFTSGLLELLDSEQLKAVAAYQIGPLVSCNFIPRTFAAALPAVFYLTAYRLWEWSSTRSERSLGAAAGMAGLAAVLAYGWGYALQLLFAKRQTAKADKFAGWAVKNIEDYHAALLRISDEMGRIMVNGEQQDYRFFDSLRSLGIVDPREAVELFLGRQAGGINYPRLRVFELTGPFPLLSRRIESGSRAGSEEEGRSGGRPLKDMVISWLPSLGFLTGALVSLAAGRFFGLPVLLGGLGLLLKLFLFYPVGGVKSLSVEELGREAETSTGLVELKGEIGPGGVLQDCWKKELLFKDRTGIVRVAYKTSVGFTDWFFGSNRLLGCLGREVSLTGWLRRGGAAFVELKQVSADSGAIYKPGYVFSAGCLAYAGLFFGALMLLAELLKS